MSDESFDELYERSMEVSDFLDKPDINEYLDSYDPEFLDAWEIAPVEDMSAEQIDAFIDMIIDWDFDDADWESLLAMMEEDFWDWFAENYEEA